LLDVAAGALVPAALAGCSVDRLAEGMRPDYADLWLTSAEVPNESPKQWQANGKRGCPIYRIQQPHMLGVTGIIPAKFFAQDGVIRVWLGDALPQRYPNFLSHLD